MAEMRVEEAAKLGFKDFIIPFYNKNKSLEEMEKKYNIKIHYIKHVEQISKVLNSIVKDLI